MKLISRTLMNGRRLALALGSMLLPSAACTLEVGEENWDEADEAVEADEIGVIEQEFTGIHHTIHTRTATDVISLGTSTNRACFLTGISGRLAMMNSVRHGARVSTANGNWQLTLRTSGSVPIRAGVACVSPVSGLTSEVTWSGTASSSPAKVVAPVTANRRCFLTQVESSVGSALGSSFEVIGDHVLVQPVGSNWVIDGATARGRIDAAVRCLNYTSFKGTFNWTAGSGLSIFPLAQAAPGVGACALQGIQGGFLSTTDVDNGAQIVYDAPAAQWFMRVKHHKTGYSSCIE